MEESYELRQRAGIWEGYLIGNPVLPIAPGYLAQYDRLGRIGSIYRHVANSTEEPIAGDNHQPPDRADTKTLYDALNRSEPTEHPSRGLDKLRILWNLDDAVGKFNFFFDTEAIDMEKLHPMVRGEILHRNFEYLKRGHDHNDARALSTSEFHRLLFPSDEMAGAAQEYLYTVFSSLGMRKKIEKEFGISLEEMPFPEQAQFLRFLNGRTKSEFDAIHSFSNQFGMVGLRTFLMNGYDERMAERIFTFAALTDQDIVKNVFARYAGILDAGEKIRQMIGDGIESGSVFEKFPAQLFESFARRSAHLFFAAEQMATYQYDTMVQLRGETMADLEQAFTGIELLASVLADAFDQKRFTLTADKERTRGGNTVFAVTDRESGASYEMKIFVRPRKETIQQGKKKGTVPEERSLQPRINIELSLDALPEGHPLRKAFYGKTEYPLEGKSVETSSIRFGFDLDDAYDPPSISFDMGRNAHRSARQVRTGDVLGRILDRVAPSGHHLIESFDPVFSEPEQFAHLAEVFQAAIDRVRVLHPR